MRAGEAAEDAGGDAACWLSRVCPQCGAMLEDPAECWRCHQRFDAEGAPIASE